MRRKLVITDQSLCLALGQAADRCGLAHGVLPRSGLDPEALQVAMDWAQEDAGTTCAPWIEALTWRKKSRATKAWLELSSTRLWKWTPSPSDPQPQEEPPVGAAQWKLDERLRYCTSCGWLGTKVLLYRPRPGRSVWWHGACPGCREVTASLWRGGPTIPQTVDVTYDPPRGMRFMAYTWTVYSGRILWSHCPSKAPPSKRRHLKIFVVGRDKRLFGRQQ